MPLAMLFFWTVPIVALTSYCLLILFLLMSQKDKYIRSFMLVLGALIVWTASALLMKLQLYPGVLFWNKIMLAGTFAVPFLVYNFVSVFTDTRSIFKTIIWGGLTAASIIVALSGLVVTDANVITYFISVDGRQVNIVEFVYKLGILATPVYILLFSIITSVLFKVRAAVIIGNTTTERITLISIGVIIMFIGSLTNVFPSLGKYPLDILACFINAILIMVAIYKYRLLELRFMLTRGIVYSVLAIILTGVYVYSVFYVQSKTNQIFGDLLPYFTTITSLMVAFIFQPLYRLTNRLVDKMFYKAEYSQRQALRNFSSVISNNLDLNSIAEELIGAVQLAIRAKHILILTRYEDEGYYKVFKTSSQLYQPDFHLSFDNPIVGWFLSDHPSLSRDELYSLPFFKSMWDKEKKKIFDLGVEVIIPIKSRNEVIGLLLLSGKNNNTAYILDDLDLLTYLGASTGVAFDNAQLYSRTQTEALTDSLTKLYNHRYFFKALNEQMERVGSSELSILMLDLDLFKLFNDLYGHVEGDRALERVASIMVRIVGEKGSVCRYGGEEFTVLLPFHDSKRAYDIAEKIRLEIQRQFFNLEDVTQRFLTISIGVCTYPHAAPNGEELLKRADLAMYTAKSQGKNQTVIYTPRQVTSGDGYNQNGAGINFDHTYAATIYALTAAIDAKDHYTFGHSQKVAEYATELALKLNLDKSHVEIVKEAALLHDIGKIGIPENILTKTGRLTGEEFDIVKQHVEMSITIIKHLPSLNHVVPAVIGHHERWDGKGYPRGLQGENIPLSSRCLSIADSFDAMTSIRPYRSNMSVGDALNEIEKNSGTQFDPHMAKIFIGLVQEGVIKVDTNEQSVPIKSVS